MRQGLIGGAYFNGNCSAGERMTAHRRNSIGDVAAFSVPSDWYQRRLKIQKLIAYLIAYRYSSAGTEAE